MFSIKILIFLLLVSVPNLIVAQDSCISAGDCLPPNCFCASYKTYWTNLTADQIPQFVLLTLDDSLVPAFDTLLTTIKKYKNNKNSNRNLPFTLYSMFDYTQFDLMQKFYSWGHEIAIHTLNHNTSTNTSWDIWFSQIKTAIDTFSNLANIPKSAFVGFRAPFLAFNSEMFEVLSQLGFLYDSSMTEQVKTQGPSFNTSTFIWPYTFDNLNAQGTYSSGIPPSHEIPQLFEVPMWLQYVSGTQLQSMDAGATAAQLMTLLNQRRSSNKAPLGIFNHIQSYSSTTEIESFITQCLALPDEYMQNPVPYTQLNNQPYMQWTELSYPTSTPNSCSNYLFSTFNTCPATTPTAPTIQTLIITLNNVAVTTDSSLCNTFSTCNFSNGGSLSAGQKCVLNNEIWQAQWWINVLPPGTGWTDMGSCLLEAYGGQFSFDQPSYHVVKGDSATFGIIPDSGYSIDKVVVNSVNMGAISSYTFTNVQSNQTISAYFKVGSTQTQTYTITATGSYGCNVAQPTTTVNQGGNATFTFTPANSTCSINSLLVDATVIAASSSYTFTNVQTNHSIIPICLCNYTLTAQNSNGCVISPSTKVVTQNSQQTFTISTSNSSCTLQSVTVDSQNQGSISSYSFSNITASHTIGCSATCQAANYTVTVQNSGCTVNPAQSTTVLPGGNQTFSISAPVGTAITGFTLNGQAQTISNSSAFNYSINNINSNQVFTVTCSPLQYTVTVTNNGCVVSPLTTQTVNYGNSLTYNISTGSGCTLNSIAVNNVTQIITNPYVVTNIQENKNLVATCTCPQTYTITASTSQCNMSPLGSVSVAQGGSQQYSISASQNCSISSILLNNQSVTISNTSSMTVLVDNVQQNTLINSVCTCPIYYTITASTSGCTMSPSGTVTLLQGSNQAYSISSGSGCIISTLLLNGVSQTVPANSQSMSFSISNLNGNKTLQSTCTCPTFTIAASTTACTMSPLGNTTVSYGGSQSYSISASTGCNITSIQLNSQNQSITNSSAMTFIVNNVIANQTLKSTCTCPVMYTITSTATNCAVSPLGAVQVASGQSQNFSITANAGCTITSVKVNSSSKTITNNTSMVYAFTNVAANATLASTCTCPTSFTVTSSTTNCTMSPLGTSSVTSGGSLTFSITAPSGCSISSLLLNGASQSLTSTSSFSYTINSILSNQTLASSCSCTSSNSSSSVCNYTHWSATSYAGGTQVFYEGNGYSYVSLYWAGSTQVPSLDSVWKLTSYCGQTAPCAEAWVSGKAYSGGDIVMYNNNKYSAQYWTNQSIAPNAAGSVFTLIGSC